MTTSIQNELVNAAVNLGATQAKIFNIGDICFDPRAFLKCLYGCHFFLHHCPTIRDTAAVSAYPEIIQKYQWGVMLQTDNLKTGQEITLAIESKAFYKGFYFAFGATGCATCHECNRVAGKDCVDRARLRPPLYSLGIDVYKTVRKFGWELEVMQQADGPRKNITAVFVE